MYFTKETDAAIVEYQQTNDEAIFNKVIKPAFETLVESLIYTYRFFGLGDVPTLKREAFAMLYEMIPKFDATRGTKGFSYFNVGCRNFFIHKAREMKRRAKNSTELDLDNEIAKKDPSFVVSSYEEKIEDAEQWRELYAQMESWRDRLKKANEKTVLEAVIYLMRFGGDLVTIYNKKAVYLYLREMTGLDTKQVVVNLKKIRELYVEWQERYSSTGEG